MMVKIKDYLRSEFPKLYKFLKFTLKNIFYYSCYFFIKYPSYEDSEIFGNNYDESFFGYYDNFPVSEDGKHIFYHAKNKSGSFVVITKQNKIVFSHRTNAQNYQQGSRACWLSRHNLIFNDSDSNTFSKIYNLESKKIVDLRYPFMSKFNSEMFWSINFENLKKWDPDYGYQQLSKNSDTSASIKLVSLENEIVSEIDLNQISLTLDVDVTRICVNHLFTSPDKKKLGFLLRSFSKKGKNNHLISYDLGDKNFRSLHFSKGLSHYNWVNENEIIFFDDAYPSGYRIIHIPSGKQKKIFSTIKFDGHPTVKNGVFISDSYSDIFGRQKLIHGSMSTEQTEDYVFKHPPTNFGAERCDLHPRYDSKQKTVYIDTLHFGKRRACKIKLKREF